MTRLNKKFFQQVIIFALVGIIAAVVHLNTVIFLVQFNWVNNPLIANIYAFILAFQVSYFGHRYITFKGTKAAHNAAYLKLIILQIINFSLNESLFYVLMRYLPYPIALLFVLSVLPIFTFIISKLWVFRF